MATVDVPLPRSTAVEKLAVPYIDSANLLLIDRDPLTAIGSVNELTRRARDNVQSLLNKIWELDKKRVDEAILAVLPAPVYRLPREKKIPEKKALTKWEEYSKEKGIKKVKKRAKKVYDEASGEWKPRFGYRRANDGTKDWCIEVPDHKDPETDMFEERRTVKKQRVQKNELQRMRNIVRQNKLKTGGRLPSTESLASVGVGKDPTERSKQEIRVTADRAKTATASIGKFQEKLKNEKPNVKTGKKRKFEPNLANAAGEREKYLSILKGVLDKKPRILEHKAAEVAGPIIKDGGEDGGGGKRRQAKGERLRQKNVIHRQKHFQGKVKNNKKTRGNARKEKK